MSTQRRIAIQTELAQTKRQLQEARNSLREGGDQMREMIYRIRDLTKERDSAQAKCAEMHCLLSNADPCDALSITNRISWINAKILALSGNCGQDFMPRKELDPVIDFLTNLLDVTGEFLDDETGHYTKLTEDLLLKMKVLRRGPQ